MNSHVTNIFLFIVVLGILTTLFLYTKITKESFFNNSSELPKTMVILDGKTANGNYNIYTDQVTDTCSETCQNYLVDPYRVCSANVQGDGNYVIYNSSGKAVWASNTNGKGYSPPFRTIMQGDGNLVLYDSNNRPVWSSGTQGKGSYPFRLIMQSDCNLVVYDANWRPTWSSGTSRSTVKGTGPAPPTIKTTTNWYQIPGYLHSVSLSPNEDIFGTNLAGEIYYKTKAYIDFRKIPGNMNTITTDGRNICGINNNNDILFANYGEGIKGNWSIIHRNAKSVSTSNNKIYGVSTSNALMYSLDISDLNNVGWFYVPLTYARFHSVSLDGNTFVGINENNDLYYSNQNIFSSQPKLIKMKVLPDMRNFINVTLKGTKVLVTDTEGNLWYCSNYRTPNWIKIKNKQFTFMASMN
jgi:hypothetical protein